MTDLLLAELADASMRVAVLAVALTLVVALFRIRSGGARHAVWSAGVIAMLLTPVLSRLVPPVSVPLPPAVAFRTSDISHPAILPNGAGAPREPTAEPGMSAEAIETVTSANTAAAAPADLPAPVPWPAIVLALYLTGVAFLLARLVLGWLHLSAIHRHSRRIAEPGAAEFFESALVAAPATIGMVAPRIVLPPGWRSWPADMLAAVTAHERAHASRRDPFVALLARLNCALYWFHPASWWLARQLAIDAEHACDDAALAEVPRRRYAETLLAIAATVRRHRGRLVWHGVGVDGGGRLGRRIDRVLAAAPPAALSRTRAAALAVSCALAIGGAISCRQRTTVEPLREDPQLAIELKAQQERQEAYRSAEQMRMEDAVALERVLEQNPEDAATREKLLVFYLRGKNRDAQAQKDSILARRRHALWLVEHHPESELVGLARVFKPYDPEGYEQLRNLWLTMIARPDTSAVVLNHAASFFEGAEKPVAEEILLRGRARYPGGVPSKLPYVVNWSQRLGALYGNAILGRPADDPDAVWARSRLEASNDARILYSAAYDLSWRPREAEVREFGRRLLERASQLDENIATRVRALAYQRNELNPVFGSAPRESWPALLAKSTGLDRLRQLVSLTESEYLGAEYYDWLSRRPDSARRAAGIPTPAAPEQEQQRAADMFARSRAYAHEAIELGGSLNGSAERPDLLFRARLAAGLHALREGDRDDAVGHLLAASDLPLSEMFTERRILAEDRAFALEYRLVNYLLKDGERVGVIEYLERGATHRSAAKREEMLKAAAAIRDGRMPEHYQRLLASGSL